MTDLARSIISRAEAQARSLKRYYTGEPCKYGHVTERSTVNRCCFECARLKTRAYREANYEEVHQAALESQRRRRAADPQKHIDEVTAWAKANPGKRRVVRRRWKTKNPEKVRADSSGRRAKVRGQTCECCVPADFEAIYRQGRETGCEVDHIEPIALGGLHCCKNLQVLSKEVHREKSRGDISEAQKRRHARRRGKP